MTTRIRLLAGSVTFAGAALLASATPAYSTMSLDLLDLQGTRYCCGSDTNGDGQADSYCCYRTGCTAGPGGCTRVPAE
jgi:hypothetical protein